MDTTCTCDKEKTCYGCPDRFPACHDKCECFARRAEKRRAENEARRKQQDDAAFFYDEIQKVKKNSAVYQKKCRNRGRRAY